MFILQIVACENTSLRHWLQTAFLSQLSLLLYNMWCHSKWKKWNILAQFNYTILWHLISKEYKLAFFQFLLIIWHYPWTQFAEHWSTLLQLNERIDERETFIMPYKSHRSSFVKWVYNTYTIYWEPDVSGCIYVFHHSLNFVSINSNPLALV